MKSREEIRFLALLSKTQEKAAKFRNGQNASKNDENHCDNGDDLQNDLTGDSWRLPKVSYFVRKFSNPNILKNFVKSTLFYEDSVLCMYCKFSQ